MKHVRLGLAISAALAAVAFAGVAGAVNKHPPPRMVTVPHANPVSKDDLRAAGATCSGETCIFHGATWDCTIQSDCHVVKGG